MGTASAVLRLWSAYASAAQSPGPACAGPGVTAWGLLPAAFQLAGLSDSVHTPEDRLRVVAGVTDRYGDRRCGWIGRLGFPWSWCRPFSIRRELRFHLDARSAVADGQVLGGLEAQGHLVEGGGEDA